MDHENKKHNIRNAITIIGCCCRKMEKPIPDDDIVRYIDICIEQLNRIRECLSGHSEQG